VLWHEHSLQNIREQQSQEMERVGQSAMRILLLNYHYFLHGGPDRYFFNVKAALERRGHDVVPFSFNYSETQDSPYREYFPEPITGRAPYLSPHAHLGPGAKAVTAARMFWNPEAARKFRAILRATHPDLVYSIYLSSSFLPQLLRIAKSEFGLPVLYRLSDFHMLCGSYTFYRDGASCTDCLEHGLSLVKHRCMHGSLAGSLLRYLQMKYIRLMHWYGSVDCFLCPSEIMRSYLVKYARLPEQKVLTLPTFARDIGPGKADRARPYALFLGNITPEKGAEVLVRAYNALSDPGFGLRLAGTVQAPYRAFLESLLDEDHRRKVRTGEYLQGDDLWNLVRGALFVVHPALWMENMPNALLEGMSAGKPLLVSDIGSLQEMVTSGKNGILVSPGDVAGLSAGLSFMSLKADLDGMGKKSRQRFLQDFTEEIHVGKLLALILKVKAE
jgi:glycosyltransferase involved in cell wall biosynthesis